MMVTDRYLSAAVQWRQASRMDDMEPKENGKPFEDVSQCENFDKNKSTCPTIEFVRCRLDNTNPVVQRMPPLFRACV